jgi:Cu+-exporting ATPase
MEKEIILKIDGMMCAHCKNHVEEALIEIEGVIKAEADVDNAIAKVIIDKEINFEEYKEKIDDAGYELIELLA